MSRSSENTQGVFPSMRITVHITLLCAALMGVHSTAIANDAVSGFTQSRTIVSNVLARGMSTTEGELSRDLEALQQALHMAETQSADTMVRFALFAAWVVHRESKKVPSSQRLIQITKSTGRTEEIQRYERRHAVLIANIEAATQQYTEAVHSLSLIDRGTAEAALKQVEVDLIEQGMVENIRVCQLVAKHVQQYLDSGQANGVDWKNEFEAL